VNLASAALVLAADQERLDLDRERQDARVPAVAVEEQVLAVLEPEQRVGGKGVARGVEPEQDRIFGLHPAELVGDDEAGHHGVAVVRAALGADAQGAVRFGGQDLVGGHANCSIGLGAAAAASAAR
jgi:hypothetical protein